MSIDSALQRVATLNQALSNPASLVGSTARLSGGTAAPAEASATTGEPTFAAALQSASASYSTATQTVPTTTPALSSSTLMPANASAPGTASLSTIALGGQSSTTGSQILAAAESQVGQAEQPPGSNESPAIAEYRSATAGATPGAPWCAYFASWAARQAGEPLGAQGEGLGSVSAIWSWAQNTARAIPNGPGVTPKPGDLIVFGGEHVGIVRGVLPNGNIQTIEGNYENKVALNERPPGEATGYVSMS